MPVVAFSGPDRYLQSTQEGNSGTHAVTAQVSLSAPSLSTVAVQYATSTSSGDQWATSGVDFTATSGTLFFAPGEKTKAITVSVIGDTVYEGRESFFINLTEATGATLSLNDTETRNLVDIINDDLSSLPDNFNGLDYLASYGDLAAAFGTDEHAATIHYFTNGRAEGRVADNFNGLDYLASYGDLAAAFGTDERAAALHYITKGRAEGRVADNFNGLDYLASYGDLAAAFGTDEHATALHYITNGRAEGRVPTLIAPTDFMMQVEGVVAHYPSDLWFS